MNLRRVLFATSVMVVLSYLATGFVVVEQNERALVRRFGRALAAPLPPGLHYVLPWGLCRVDRMRVDETRLAVVGSDTASDDLADQREEINESSTGRFLTGDQNVVHLGLSIHYTLADPAAHLFGAKDSSRIVGLAAESLATDVVAGLTVDEILLGAQSAVAEPVAQRLQRQMDDRFGLGVRIRGVSVTGVSPPAEVADAFSDVLKARSEKEQQINEAHSSAEKTRRAAQVRAEQILNAARGEARRRQTDAEGQARRFEQLVSAYRAAANTADVRARLILETVEEIFPRVTKFLVGAADDQQPIDLSIIRTMNDAAPRGSRP